MKIYTYVRIDIDTGETLEEVFYDYDGPVLECKGGGGSTTTTTSVDKAYNSQLASIAETELDWAEEFKNLYTFGATYDPARQVSGYYNESGTFIEGAAPQAGKEQGFIREDGSWVSKKDWETIRIKKINNPGQVTKEEQDLFWAGHPFNKDNSWDVRVNPEYKQVSGTYGDMMGYNPDKVISQMELEQMQTAANAKLVPKETATALAESVLRKKQARALTALVPRQREVAEKFYDKALEGIDIGERVNKARMDVGQAFGNAEQRTTRALGGMGIDPSSGRGESAYSDTGLEYGKALSGATTGARRQAETDEYNRLGTAMGVTQAIQ